MATTATFSMLLRMTVDFRVLGAALRKHAAISLDISKGDTLLGGRFKNHAITVEDIGEDELGQPTINGRKLLAYRIKKKMPS